MNVVLSVWSIPRGARDSHAGVISPGAGPTSCRDCLLLSLAFRETYRCETKAQHAHCAGLGDTGRLLRRHEWIDRAVLVDVKRIRRQNIEIVVPGIRGIRDGAEAGDRKSTRLNSSHLG